MTSDDFWHKWIRFLVVENVGIAVEILQLGHSNEEICDLTAFSRCTAAILVFHGIHLLLAKYKVTNSFPGSCLLENTGRANGILMICHF